MYEAIIAGTKVVTTDSTGDMKLHITSECVTVVPKKDYAEFAAQVLNMIERHDTKVTTLPKHFEQFKLDYAVAEYLKYLEA